MSKNQIFIANLSLVNFKGIKKLNLDFGQVTNIYGDNGTGKTTIFDAFCWLLFGKDSTDRKEFEIKTIEPDGKTTPKIEHEVSATLLINGEPTTLRRVLKETWVKKRGSEVSEFTGHETMFYWNDVPTQAREYQAKVSAILDETTFKLITSPFAFNAMKWTDRRNVLMSIAGDISDVEIAAGNKDFQELLANLSNKSLEDYKKQISEKIKKAKDEIKIIPTRIDEVERGKPEAVDFAALRGQLSAKESELSNIEDQIQDRTKAHQAELDKINERRTAISNLKFEIQSLETDARNKAKAQLRPDTSALDLLTRQLSEKTADLTSYKSALSSLKSRAAASEESIVKLDAEMAAKRKEWEAENAKEITFNDNDFCCPTCKRAFEAGDVEARKSEMVANFKRDKQQKLDAIKAKGVAMAAEKKELEESLSAMRQRIINGEAQISALNAEVEKIKADIDIENGKLQSVDNQSEDGIFEQILSVNEDYRAKVKQLEDLEAQTDEVTPVNIDDLKASRAAVVADIDGIKSSLRAEDQINAANKRVQELLEEEKELAAYIAGIEKTQFTIENFTKLKIDALEKAINSKFSFVRFKMFDTQINGGEKETCETLINGVPFSDANTASKINAGLDIINTLCNHFNVTAPVFIDNRESVVRLISVNSQLVNLIVSEADKALRVEMAEQLQEVA